VRRSEPEAPAIDPEEVRALARFGPSPEHWWEAPAYARRVGARVLALREDLARAEERAAAAKTALEEAFVQVGQLGIAWMRTSSRPSRGSYLKTLDRLSKRENELKAVDAQVYQEGESLRAKLAELMQKTEDLKRKLATDPKKAEELSRLREEREKIERTMKIPARSLDPKVERARADFRAACADFGQFILDDTANFGDEFDERRGRVGGLRSALDAAEKKLFLQHVALDAFDHRAVALGKGVMIGAIAAGVLVVVGGVAAIL
jgi:hypothetical protein